MGGGASRGLERRADELRSGSHLCLHAALPYPKWRPCFLFVEQGQPAG